LEPGPQGEEFCAGIADRVVEDRGTHDLEAGRKKGVYDLDRLVSSRIIVANCVSCLVS
jgi:hypothetical protein